MAWAPTAKKWERSLPVDPGLIDELEKRLVHQRRGLKGVAGPLLAHVLLSQPPQVLINHVDQFGELRSVAILDRRQQLICVASTCRTANGFFHDADRHPHSPSVYSNRCSGRVVTNCRST